MCHVISRHSSLHMKNDSHTAGLTVRTLSCHACIIRLSCTSTLSFNQGDLVLTPDIYVAKVNLRPHCIDSINSLDQVFRHLSQASSRFHVYSIAEARQSALNSVRMELAELPEVQRISLVSSDELTRPIAQYYASTSPATSAALSSYLPTTTPVLVSLTSITISFSTFCVSYTLFRRQCHGLFSQPLQLSLLVTLLSGLVMIIHLFFTSQSMSCMLCRNWHKKPYEDLFKVPLSMILIMPPLTV